MKTTHLPVLGPLQADAVSEFLGSTFLNFSTRSGITGLARGTLDYLEILAIKSRYPNRGYFRNFIRHCQSHYASIRFWVVENRDLAGALERYGFVLGIDIDDEGIPQPVADWRRE